MKRLYEVVTRVVVENDEEMDYSNEDLKSVLEDLVQLDLDTENGYLPDGSEVKVVEIDWDSIKEVK